MVDALTALLLLGFLVVVHEAGHFVVARWSGVRILCFSVGFGPKLLKWTRGHTEYALSAIPLGGYVKMAGESRSEAKSKPYEYLSKPVGTRAAIVFAGPFVNYLVAYLSLWAVFMVGYPELLPVVGKVSENMPAQAAGFQPGDRIHAVNGEPVQTWTEMTTIIYESAGKRLQVAVDRGGAERTITVFPMSKEMTDPFGQTKTVGLIGITPNGEFESYRVGPLAALGKAFDQQMEWTWLTLVAVGSMITGKIALRDSVTGPIGLVYLASEAVKMGVAPVLFLIALLSLSLAIFNVFPIPILDGGHLLFLGLEKLRGRPVSISVQERAAQVSFFLLMALILTICVFDISRFGLVDKVKGFFGL